MPGNSTGRVIEFLKYVFICQCVIADCFSQMTAERFYNWKINTSVCSSYSIAFYKVEETVCTSLVLAIEAVEVHDA